MDTIFDKRILPQYLNSNQLADVMNVSVHTVRTWRRLRIITPVKFGKSVRWLLDDVIKELSEKRRIPK